MQINRESINMLIAFLLTMTIVLLIWNFTQYRGDSFACISNPLRYGAEELSEANGFDFIATGYFVTSQNSPKVLISRHGVSFESNDKPIEDNPNSPINSSVYQYP